MTWARRLPSATPVSCSVKASIPLLVIELVRERRPFFRSYICPSLGARQWQPHGLVIVWASSRCDISAITAQSLPDIGTSFEVNSPAFTALMQAWLASIDRLFRAWLQRVSRRNSTLRKAAMQLNTAMTGN